MGFVLLISPSIHRGDYSGCTLLNCLNSFVAGNVESRRNGTTKPLKRLTTAVSPMSPHLKWGANEKEISQSAELRRIPTVWSAERN
jgi:hypothetical protein